MGRRICAKSDNVLTNVVGLKNLVDLGTKLFEKAALTGLLQNDSGLKCRLITECKLFTAIVNCFCLVQIVYCNCLWKAASRIKILVVFERLLHGKNENRVSS